MPTQFSFMFYNTENFYDTIDDPDIMDSEFTPKGRLRWDEKKFNDKVDKLTFVIQDIVKPQIPDIIGLAEIENKNVMMSILDGLHRKGMNHYSFVHYDSPDERGADVALIYNTQSFIVLESTPIVVHLPGIEDRTRDILYVRGKTTFDEVFHIFIVHFPSRREGTDRSERRRYFVASELHNAVYKVLSQNPDANAIVMGDFNAVPESSVVQGIVNPTKDSKLFDSKKLASLVYGPDWSFHEFGKIPFAERPLIDYVFISENIKVLKYGVLAETLNKCFLSDHAPVLVKVSL